MSKEYYIELGLRQEEGLLSDEESQILSQWIGADRQNEIMLEEILVAFRSTESRINPDSKSAFEEIRDKVSIPAQPPKEMPKNRSLPRYWLVAATILFLVGSISAFYILQMQSSAPLEYEAIAGSLQVSLPEGSSLTLAENTRLAFHVSKKERLCLLQGTALFDVETTAKPFIVKTDELSVRVIGTVFEVSQQGEVITIRVNEGQVQVTTTTEELILSQGDQIELRNGELSDKTKMSGAIGQWHRSSLSFDNVLLLDGLELLATYYPVKFSVKNEKLENCQLRGDLGLGSIDAMIATLEAMLDANITRSVEGMWEISGQGCDEQ